MTHATDLTSSSCPDCGAALAPDAPQGLCPGCLMRQAMTPTQTPGARGRAGVDAPGLAEVAAAFPQLEVLEMIGRGGMGAVFRARQTKLGRLVALKVIPADSDGAGAAFAERFEREGRLLARLHHPNIVTIYDSGRAGRFFYLLMEHVDGVNLRQAMRSGGFAPPQALSLVPQICDALQYAHDQGVLHRDIKPENILLDARGRVKLADFGIGKLAGVAEPAGESAGAGAEAGGLTQAGVALGTPRYMAPEQASDPQSVDHRADIYSLGVVFYELLTGELPPAGAVRPSDRVAVDRRIDAIVQQALERERDRRQRTAEEMKTQIAAAEGAVAPWGQHASRRWWQLTRVAMLVAGGLAAALGFFVWTTIRRERKLAQREQAAAAAAAELRELGGGGAGALMPVSDRSNGPLPMAEWIRGTWEFDSDTSSARSRVTEAATTEESRASAEAALAQVRDSLVTGSKGMRWTFAESTVIAHHAPEGPRSGPYEVVESRGADAVVIRTQDEGQTKTLLLTREGELMRLDGEPPPPPFPVPIEVPSYYRRATQAAATPLAR